MCCRYCRYTGNARDSFMPWSLNDLAHLCMYESVCVCLSSGASRSHFGYGYIYHLPFSFFLSLCRTPTVYLYLYFPLYSICFPPSMHHFANKFPFLHNHLYCLFSFITAFSALLFHIALPLKLLNNNINECGKIFSWLFVAKKSQKETAILAKCVALMVLVKYMVCYIYLDLLVEMEHIMKNYVFIVYNHLKPEIGFLFCLKFN